MISKEMIRPVTTVLLVVVQAALAGLWAFGVDAADPFAALSPFTMMALTFWFKARDEEKRVG